MAYGAGDRGHFIGTASGLPFWPLDPQPEDIRIFDIAVHLSRICRFGGALHPDLTGIYSVAQHSVLVSRVVPPEFALEGLLHDAAEAYVGDMVKPLKTMLEDYQAIEKIVDRAIRRKWDLPRKISKEVKEADRRVFATEVKTLVPSWQGKTPWQATLDPFDFEVQVVTPKRARDLFLQRYEELAP